MDIKITSQNFPSLNSSKAHKSLKLAKSCFRTLQHRKLMCYISTESGDRSLFNELSNVQIANFYKSREPLTSDTLSYVV